MNNQAAEIPAGAAVPKEAEKPHELVGTVVGGYRVVRKIAEGGMGVILEAKHLNLGQIAAVKVLSKELKNDRSYPEIYQRFVNEAKAISRIQHPGIVKVYDQGQLPNGTTYILMEYLDGESLDRRIARGPFPAEGTWMPIPLVLRICRQLVSALAEAHRKSIVHRDLKPSNVILVADPEAPGGERTKLLDFGIARFTDAGQNVSRTGTMLGTPLYMSPEQCMGERVDGKADVYALGAMMFEMLTGRPPFGGTATALVVHHATTPAPDLSVVVPGIPADIKALVAKMLQKDRKARPTMIHLLDELRRLEALYPATDDGRSGAAAATDPTRMSMDFSALDGAKTRLTRPASPMESALRWWWIAIPTLAATLAGISYFLLR